MTHSRASRAFIAPLGAVARRLGLAAVCLAGLLAPVAAHEFKAGSVEIVHPWSRAVPPGATVAAGYLTLMNEGAEPDRLVGVASDIAGHAEIHEMAVSADGMMTMRPLADGVEIPAGGEVKFGPGAYHIMFMGLKTRPVQGTPFKGTLTFEKAGTVEVEFAVDAMGGMGHEDHAD